MSKKSHLVTAQIVFVAFAASLLLLLLSMLVSGCYQGSDLRPAREYSPVVSTRRPPLTVVYQATTGRHDGMSLTMENSQGGTEQYDTGYHNEYERTLTGFDYGDFAYLSAQCDDANCTVKCRILVNGIIWRESTSSGSYAIASCSGRLGSD